MALPSKKGTIGILTGGGDVPGLNPAIRAITVRALREGYEVLGIRNGWEGLVRIDRSRKIEEQDYCQVLNENLVNKVGRTGGTFLHTSRARPSHMAQKDVPAHLANRYRDNVNDLTPEVLQNLSHLGVDTLIPIGGDDTLSYAVRLHQAGIKVIAIPKTMDNDVPGTDYSIGFSTCLTRTIELAHQLRTSAGSHERFLVMEVFGRYAGFTALLPTMAGAANRCVIPEHKFDIEKLAELLAADRFSNPSKYSVVLVSEGAMFKDENMVIENQEMDAYGHKKLGGIGDRVSEKLRELTPQFNHGKRIGVINQRLAYLVRCGDPDAMDSLVPMAYGNLALNLIIEGQTGRLVALRNGKYDHVSLMEVVGSKKQVDIERYYNTNRLRPKYNNLEGLSLFVMSKPV
jgi:6-phosphofructokinase 1